jgi:sigma-B regulation protein RsbU (phosphoserine phosphatase)
LRKKQKEVRWLEKGGMPLGVMEKINIKNHQIQMAVGDEIVMYTDGVTEGKSKEGEFFGEERLYNVLNAYKKNSSRRLVDLIDEKLLEFQGSEAPSDDVTILIIKRAN